MDVNFGRVHHRGAGEQSGKANFSQISQGWRKIADRIVALSQSYGSGEYPWATFRLSYFIMSS